MYHLRSKRISRSTVLDRDHVKKQTAKTTGQRSPKAQNLQTLSGSASETSASDIKNKSTRYEPWLNLASSAGIVDALDQVQEPEQTSPVMRPSDVLISRAPEAQHSAYVTLPRHLDEGWTSDGSCNSEQNVAYFHSPALTRAGNKLLPRDGSD